MSPSRSSARCCLRARARRRPLRRRARPRRRRRRATRRHRPQPKTGTIVAEPVATDLDHPATFVFDDSGALFYGERLTGEIRRIDPATGKDTSVFTDPPRRRGRRERAGPRRARPRPGLPTRPLAVRVRDAHGQRRRPRPDRAAPLHGDRGTSMQLVLDVQVAGERHNGGRMLFGPDGMLYVVVGETYDSALAQDRSVNGGKVLRMTPTGGIPADNPFPGSRIYSYGNRNSFGLAFDPKTGDLLGDRERPGVQRRAQSDPGRSQLRLGPIGDVHGEGARQHERGRPETCCTASCSTRRRSGRPASRSATAAGSVRRARAICSSAHSTPATSMR